MKKCEHDWTESDKCPLCLLKDTTVSESPSVTGSDALPLNETWESFLEWVADYAGDKNIAMNASYSREDMRYAFAAGCAMERGKH